ncbi:UDP-N-acetylmuramoyl-L-alanyl-D-glutamate--2,6-diaminopimelate ligase, partial [candidate division KSB1 bacterium]
VIVDYAHTPDALEKILRCSKEFTEGRLITVFGCGGDRDRTKRPVMGRVASEVSDQVIITSDNPRTEDPSKIISEIFKGVKKNFSEVNVIEDREQAIKQAISIARKGDTVVIAGKGHEDYQIIGTKKIHFSDVETAEKYLKDFRELYGSDS